jgi:hypothetical protein
MENTGFENDRFFAVSLVAGVVSFASGLMVNTIYSDVVVSAVFGFIIFGSVLLLVAGGLSNLRDMILVILFAPLCIIGIAFGIDAGSYLIGIAAFFALVMSLSLSHVLTESRADTALVVYGVVVLSVGEIMFLLSAY